MVALAMSNTVPDDGLGEAVPPVREITPRDKFRLHSRLRDGLSSRCLECHVAGDC